MKIKPEVVGGLLLLISSLAQAHGPGTCTTASGPDGSGGTWGDACGERQAQGNPSLGERGPPGGGGPGAGRGGNGGNGNGVEVTVARGPSLPQGPSYPPPPPGQITPLDRMNYCGDTVRKVGRNIENIDREFFSPIIDKLNTAAAKGNGINNKDSDLAWKHVNTAGKHFNEALKTYRNAFGWLGDIDNPDPRIPGYLLEGARDALQRIRDMRAQLEEMKARLGVPLKADNKVRREWTRKFFSNDPPEQIKSICRALDEHGTRSQAAWIRNTNSQPSVQRASRVETLIQQTNTYSRQMLSQVAGQMEQQASDFLEEEIKLSEELAFQGVDVARCGNCVETSRIWTDLALDTSNAVNNFLLGVMSGNYGAFVTASDALMAVTHDPSLIGNLSKNMVHILSEGPDATVEATKQAFGRVAKVFTDFQKTMLYGNAFERGEALGRIGADLLIGATGHTFVTSSLLDAGKILSRIPNPKLGKAMIKAIEASPKLAPAVADSTEAMMRAAEGVVRKHFEQCKRVRDGYNAELVAIKDVARTFLEQGHDEEFVARHVQQLRRDVGQKYKNMTPKEVRPYLYGRNTADGVNQLGPSIDDLKNGYADHKAKTWEQIIDSASKPNKRINDFFDKNGLGGNT